MKTLFSILASFLAFAAFAQAEKPNPRWNEEIVSTMETLPIQEGGRIKPLDTYARFTMLALHGKRAMKLPNGTKLTPTEWLLDCLFYPEIAKTYPTFIVDNADTITSLGLKRHEKRRDRYTYEELLPGRDKLQELSTEARKIEDANDRSLFQRQIVQLHGQVNTFEYLINSLNIARNRYPNPEGDPDQRAALVAALGGGPISASGLLQQFSKLRDFAQDPTMDQAFGMLVQRLQFDAQVSASTLIPFPPISSENEVWVSSGKVVLDTFTSGGENLEWATKRLALWETLAADRNNPEAFLATATELNNLTTSEAKERGELGQVSTEVAYYRLKPLFYSLWIAFLAAIIYAISMIRGSSGTGRKRSLAGLALTIISLVFLFIAIGMRMRIRGWEAGMGPITNLYETIIFITAFMGILALLAGKFKKNQMAYLLAPVVIASGLFVSVLFEANDASDTINSLPAVLITNFWLLTHVPTINLGYAGCMLAAFFSWVYAIARLFDLQGTKWKPFYKDLTSMAYGILCFGMVTALVGTVLGGIWANYSWGRFWGWDPKENGALMIVLWSLAILHARMGGFIKQIGFHLCSIIGGAIVTFSWFHTNLLGVGLHTYGFSGGLKRGVLIFYALSAVIFIIALFPKFITSKNKS